MTFVSRPPMVPASPRQVAIIGFPGAQSLDLVGPFEVFSCANSLGGHHVYDVALASEAGGDIHCNSGLAIGGAVPLNALPDELDTVLVVGGSKEAVTAAGQSEIPGWLLERHHRIRRIGSVCSGALVLARTGLLDGRRATTHWGFCDQMRDVHPTVRLEPDSIFVADPPVYTSAGVTACIDLSLALVEEDCGHDLSVAIARLMVLFMRRGGGQSQFSPVLRIQDEAAPRLQKLISEIVADPRGTLSAVELASRAAMSERNFSRMLKKQTGLTPAALVQSARLNLATDLLERSNWTLERIAERAGFGSVGGLQRAFQKRLGTSPSRYRRHFGMTGATGSMAGGSLCSSRPKRG